MSTSESAPEDETPNQKAARLRRERRNAKILASGSERLNKITSASGRPAPVEDDVVRPSPHASLRAASSGRSLHHTGLGNEDPEEVDISTMFRRDFAPQPSINGQDDFLQQLLAGTQDPSQHGAFPGGAFPHQTAPGGDDPMAQMMQQMQQMLGGDGGGGPGGLPAGLAGMFGGGGQGQAKAANPLDYVWRIVHAIFALGLGVYAVAKLPFVGSEDARLDSLHVQNSQGSQLFWIFATVELMLQSTRYFLDQGQLPPSGILYTVGSLLPEPYAGYIRTFGRYSIIWTTIVSDAMVIVFILGCTAWWQGISTS